MDPRPPHDLPISNDSVPAVPVFDCHVLLRETENGFEARTANLDGISTRGPTEREALLQIVKLFKSTVEKYVRAGQAIPFRAEPHAPEPTEVERWIPVHL